MLALALAVFLLLALWRAIRARHLLATSGILLEGYGLAMDGANGLAHRHEDGNTLEGFIVVFLGPSASFVRGAGQLPTLPWFVAHPIVLHGLAIALAITIVVVLHRQANRLRPESKRARQLDAVASPLVFVASMEAILLVMLAMMARLMADFM